MARQASKVLKRLQETDYKPWETRLWLVKRRLVGKEAAYSVVRVETDTKLNRRLKAAITRKLNGQNLVLEEYTFLSADQDDRLFTIDSSETDFVKIEQEIRKGLANERATQYEQLLNSWAYVIELRYPDHQAIYGMRKVNALTQTKKVTSLTSLLFENDMLIDLSNKQILTLDLSLDVLVSGGLAFIVHKKDFESALNFRRGMEDNRDETLQEFGSLGIFSDVGPLRLCIGANLHYLRKISAIRKSGYYKGPNFMANLIRVSQEEGWRLEIVNGKIIATAESADTILTLLGNSRLKSPINQEVFDAVVKKKVE